ncbi:protein of unknown function [Methylorubrum extorquens]|uniref:Uncharacterized protein n=1 Tax=Methylorubrum extorquens TaxID=408 RepID=A0A2N9AZJ1_METEX|nr:protein of unknown function [Methylorubrum extorquens]
MQRTAAMSFAITNSLAGLGRQRTPFYIDLGRRTCTSNYVFERNTLAGT